MARCHCRLGTHNLDMLILFVKTWPNESHVGATTPCIEPVIWKALVKIQKDWNSRCRVIGTITFSFAFYVFPTLMYDAISILYPLVVNIRFGLGTLNLHFQTVEPEYPRGAWWQCPPNNAIYLVTSCRMPRHHLDCQWKLRKEIWREGMIAYKHDNL